MKGPVHHTELMSVPQAELYLNEYSALSMSGRQGEVRRGLLGYLAEAPFPDAQSDAHYGAGFVVTPHETIHAITGKDRNALDALHEFSRATGIQLQIEPHNRHQGRARSVRVVHRPEFARRLAEQSLADAAAGDVPMVHFPTLEPYSERQARDQSRKDEQRKLEMAQCEEGHVGREIQDLIHGQPTQALRTRLDATRDAVLDLAAKITNPYLQKHCAGITDHIHRSPRQILHPVDGSDRLFAYLHANYYPRQMRKASMRGNWSGDLACAQLAAASMAWGAPILQRYLWDAAHGDKVKPWQLWLDYCGLDVHDDVYKVVLKRGVYAITFGASERSVLQMLAYGEKLCDRRMREELGLGCGETQGFGEDRAKRLLGHPMMEELLKCRHEAVDRALAHGWVDDAFGRRLFLPETMDGHDPRRAVRSLMARQMQSYEMALMNAMVPTLTQYKRDVGVHLWMHDGLVLHFRKGNVTERVKKLLEKDISAAAKHYDIPTWLEWEQN